MLDEQNEKVQKQWSIMFLCKNTIPNMLNWIPVVYIIYIVYLNYIGLGSSIKQHILTYCDSLKFINVIITSSLKQFIELYAHDLLNLPPF